MKFLEGGTQCAPLFKLYETLPINQMTCEAEYFKMVLLVKFARLGSSEDMLPQMLWSYFGTEAEPHGPQIIASGFGCILPYICVAFAKSADMEFWWEKVAEQQMGWPMVKQYSLVPRPLPDL